ncbi:MFS transporter [Massilia eurypsychrophila]|jgi:predicted MFS family arabinose efflux permease|uniref:MFS transporter n=1 Tax=Massilia eurypsychrophila TaxID=1485217 RepID=A0A2G8TIP3_9BURK|nr:MFS transporter [Massilia eurypsychrophila]PIL45915.1 MFS transporter [Massilia eurypsychrophila]
MSKSLPLPAQPLRQKVPLSKPLRHARYRRLWTANLISNLGTWTQTFASAWLIASLAHSASTTTLVQTATYVPIFLFALFAGVVADAVNRPKFLFFCNLFMALCACTLAALVITGHASARPVLAITFCLGAGSAFMWPAWQASMSGLVDPDEVEAAATLNNLSYNVAAIVGPALGGVLFNWIGAGALFLVNAISFVALLGVYWAWWQERLPSTVTNTSFIDSLKAGVSCALGCSRYRNILVNVCTVFFATIAFAALLPIFVRDVLRMNSSVFGTLMGSLGAGAVIAAFILPSLRTRFDKTRLLAGALLVYGAMLVVMSFARSLLVLVPLIMLGGMAWSATVSTLNAAAQLSFPSHIRARTLSIYLFVMAAGYTVGSLVWGRLADQFGVQAAFAVAGSCVIVNAIALVTGKREKPL